MLQKPLVFYITKCIIVGKNTHLAKMRPVKKNDKMKARKKSKLSFSRNLIIGGL